MMEVKEITQLHREMVIRWHQQELDNPYDGWLSTVCRQHGYNFLLWHEEDIARSPTVSDQQMAEVKRRIDRYNQMRNDWIEKVDDSITGQVLEQRIAPAQHAKLNTETPGSAIDRLSIIALRLFHLEEQIRRDDVSQQHAESVQQKLAICQIQLDDLSDSLQQLLNDIFAGRCRHKTYRQLKMYNDPALNPYIYEAKKRMAG